MKIVSDPARAVTGLDPEARTKRLVAITAWQTPSGTAATGTGSDAAGLGRTHRAGVVATARGRGCAGGRGAGGAGEGTGTAPEAVVLTDEFPGSLPWSVQPPGTGLSPSPQDQRGRRVRIAHLEIVLQVPAQVLELPRAHGQFRSGRFSVQIDLNQQLGIHHPESELLRNHRHVSGSVPTGTSWCETARVGSTAGRRQRREALIPLLEPAAANRGAAVPVRLCARGLRCRARRGRALRRDRRPRGGEEPEPSCAVSSERVGIWRPAILCIA
jgi:hypothetical protein